MADWPVSFMPPAPVIHPWSPESIGAPLVANNTPLNPASATYPTGSVAIYVPFLATNRMVVKQMFIANGAAVSGNVDVGIYSEDGTRLVSKGSTAQSGTSVIQTLDITDTQIGPGLFFMAVVLDNTTGTLQRIAPSAEYLRACGVFQQASAFALPATATFATMAQAYMPVFGLTARTVI